ncbi:sialidase family protein [Runella slithyformis]|uniref:Exo-alpha-sialidase n=1 Tax=Runella slithyformis (strain ATCC 29530 / DSM 19594 / LMG 11500 / NCIMB 11436 / LSU 4) TaxID=761193 RepID=A0A7U3ZPL3_RUNSL|nr:sialidase family protein [Runella slithyformis]AEI51030.1 hypothetical protein Runsl_4711 [Runella slithyformis DSM 19594]
MKSIITLFLSLCIHFKSYSQSITLPKLTFTEIQALQFPEEGQILYDLTFKCLRVYNGTKWISTTQNSGMGVEDYTSLSKVYGETFVNTALPVSKFETETYAHSSYIKIINNTCYVLYMCNDKENFEGGINQKIRLSTFNLLMPTQKTITEIAQPSQTSGSFTLDNMGLQVPNMLQISQDTLRLFFRGSVSKNRTILYRDYSLTTGALTNFKTVKATIARNQSIVPLNLLNVYAHLDYLFGPGHGIGEIQDFFMTSEIEKIDDALYSVISVGSGLGKTTTSILVKSTDNGATWSFLGAPDPRFLPGTNSMVTKYMWEGAITSSSTEIYLFCRSVNNGITLTKANKSNLYNFTIPIKIWNTGNAKPLVFNYPGIGLIGLFESSSSIEPNLLSNRTALDVVRISNNYSAFTKLYTISDYSGIHTPSYCLYNNEIFISYTGDKLRRTPKNCGQIFFSRLKRNSF